MAAQSQVSTNVHVITVSEKHVTHSSASVFTERFATYGYVQHVRFG
jgi:hypothetical protein